MVFVSQVVSKRRGCQNLAWCAEFLCGSDVSPSSSPLPDPQAPRGTQQWLEQQVTGSEELKRPKPLQVPAAQRQPVPLILPLNCSLVATGTLKKRNQETLEIGFVLFPEGMVFVVAARKLILQGSNDGLPRGQINK